MIANPLNPPLPRQPGECFTWENLPGFSAAFLLSQAAQKAEAPLLIVTETTKVANQLHQLLSCLLPHFPLYLLPDWEILPYDHFSPHQDLLSERLLTLSRLPHLTHGIVIVSVTTALHYLPPTSYVHAYTFSFHTGMPLEWEKTRAQWIACGYQWVPQVTQHGECAMRGSILDIFPMGASYPIRIDLSDNTIDSLRTFDKDTQRSLQKIERFSTLPAREYPLTQEAIALFQKQWEKQFSSDPRECPLYQSVCQRTPRQGIEYYLPLFFEKMQTLFDYLPSNTLLVRPKMLSHASDSFWESVTQRYEEYRHDRTRPLLPPRKLFLPTNDFLGGFKKFRQIWLQPHALEKTANKPHHFSFALAPLPDVTMPLQSPRPLEKLETFLAQFPEKKVLLCAESAGRRDILSALLARFHLAPLSCPDWQSFFQSDTHASLGITVLPIEEGASFTGQHWMWIAENQLYGSKRFKPPTHSKQKESADSVRHLSELTLNAPIVHLRYGIGRYRGLVTLTVSDRTEEYLLLEYADQQKLYVPVSSLHLITPYTSLTDTAPLHKLGSEQWEKAKQKAAQQARDVAAELLDLYAKRSMQKGFQFSPPDEDYFQFAEAFPFEETPDQAKAIQAILEDMQSSKPMDRLVCGDVGFGKTEVALRAAFLAVQNQKQVAVLVPTTLLAQQHFESFSDRFSGFPVRIEVLSRFTTPKAEKHILQALKEGRVDILIGTHKLLQPKVRFHELGLILIDEEHRFGVKHKEKLKALRHNVHILALTATPIPRTLHMSLSQLRDLSIIATPPLQRLSVKTFVREYHFPLIIEAIQRELLRGGQVYYLYNDIETIEERADLLREALPHVRIEIAHGQMREKQLEHIMADFYHQRFQVLVCTTIIESGIDIPTANTMIIHRADMLGLAQLHQLRGRVGRSHHQAYAYCFTPPTKQITPEAIKRLDAFQSLEALGSGFTLATHDLEIRGAGELLGEDQSGNMHAIGLPLYQEFLEKAVHALKTGQTLEVSATRTEVDLQVAALIPDTYLSDVPMRLALYKRIAHARSEKDLIALRIEMTDRFGKVPEPTLDLLQITALKLKAEQLGIQKIEVSSTRGKMTFEPSPPIHPKVIMQWVQEKPQHFKLLGPSQLQFTFEMTTKEERLRILEGLLAELARSVTVASL